MIGFILGVIVTVVIFDYYQNPRRVVNRLWKKMTAINSSIYELSKVRDKEFSIALLEQSKQRLGKRINAYLVVYFDEQKDEAYIEEHRFKDF